jgi:hypothetical protein
VAADVFLIARSSRYAKETERLRAGMSAFELERADAALLAESRRLAMMVELVRQQARGEQELHLTVELDSGRLSLRRGPALLRDVPMAIGPAGRVGLPPDTIHMSVPLGKSAVQRVLGANDAWEVPLWVYAERGEEPPVDRVLAGALGPSAVLLEGGTVIYSLPARGPLADPDFVLPGAIRVNSEDLQAIVANLRTGAAVYFY